MDSQGSRSALLCQLCNIAQQCYLLIGLTDDPRLKTYLLEIGLTLERQMQSLEIDPSSGDEPDRSGAFSQRAGR